MTWHASCCDLLVEVTPRAKAAALQEKYVDGVIQSPLSPESMENRLHATLDGNTGTILAAAGSVES